MTLDPRGLTGVVIGHLHADHFLDLAALRYLHPWDGAQDGRPAVWLPPGGRERLAGLARMMSERPTFFEEAFDVFEYRSDETFEVGAVSVHPTEVQHYVPAWALTVVDAAGARLVYGGDTGPTDRLVEAAGSADLFIAEATLASVDEDEPSRGHCTLEESIGMAEDSSARHVLLTHYPSSRRAALVAAAAAPASSAAGAASVPVTIAVPGLEMEISAATEIGREVSGTSDARGPWTFGLPDRSPITG
jgi:ribonuclease BN (tRNA processing enzyme)